MSDSILCAKLVWDGGDSVFIPNQMGLPRNDQMQGTAAERLTELAGRVCYDSLGKGRPSFSHEIQQTNDPEIERSLEPKNVQGFHDHILEVKHLSVCEHFNFTVIFEADDGVYFAPGLLNRPGVLAKFDTPDSVRVTTNLRAVIEWARHSGAGPATHYNQIVLEGLTSIASKLAPNIVTPVKGTLAGAEDPSPISSSWWQVSPVADEEKWISIFLSGSRGFSHEQVRHGDWTAISQRSTRYVDESESSWVEHPLETAYLKDLQRVADGHADDISYRANETIDRHTLATAKATENAQQAYRRVVGNLEPWLVDRGVDKLTARKQARGAARGYLGNALYTEMIFSASVAQWRWMLQQRCSDAADAEIRLIYNQVLPELQRSRYGDRFADMALRPAKDGIGMVLA